ncbi:hypothetical protein [Vibrio gazogenes]|uniref:hypothetical protein n=1 Tax=Vibrio gazogenes TaxID=687 RepID=UPI0018DF6E91|nr:hypothetical protein [Vibrio gazogenes]
MQDHTNETVDSPRKGQRKKGLTILLVVILIAAIGGDFITRTMWWVTKRPKMLM